ncbi:DHH family phosphoesterase [Methanocaldococcus vulcanius]|nr:bifunctional oligoribonuclease/PAP phosphatase NrnA [Methanocaldococcus vulcanius]
MASSEKLIEYLKRDEILFLCHHNADPDAIGSCVALKYLASYLNPQGTFKISADSVSKISRNILNEIGEHIDVEIYPKLPKTVFIVDTSSINQLKVNFEELKKRDVIIIDHHKKTDLAEVSKFHIIEENRPSTSEIIAEIFKELSIFPPKYVRIALLCGIVYDTKHLKLANQKTFDIISYLIKGISFQKILYLLSQESDSSKRTAHLKACSRMEIREVDGIKVALSYVSSHEASCAKTIVSIGADVSFVVAVRKKEKEIRVSARCRKHVSKYVHMGDLMEELGKELKGSGGGHSEAGGLNAPYDRSKSKDEIIKEVLDLCYRRFVEKYKTAKTRDNKMYNKM